MKRWCFTATMVGVNVAVLLQEFMRVYDILREELLADDLIAGQPSFSAEYMRKVRLHNSA